MITINAQTGEIQIHQGDDQTARFTVTDEDGAAVDVTGGTFKFTVKASLDGANTFQLTSAGGDIDTSQEASGIIDVVLEPADTATLSGLYFYDLEMTLSSKVRTLRRGVFRVLKDVS